MDLRRLAPVLVLVLWAGCMVSGGDDVAPVPDPVAKVALPKPVPRARPGTLAKGDAVVLASPALARYQAAYELDTEAYARIDESGFRRSPSYRRARE